MTMQHNHFDPKLMGIRIMQKRNKRVYPKKGKLLDDSKGESF